MKRKVVDWTVERLQKNRENINFPEFQREKRLWNNEKKSLLIDSILRDIDIPKLYFSNAGSRTYDVIDGQQRLWAIWDFLNDEFEYEGHERLGDRRKRTRYSDLDLREKEVIQSYELQVTEITGAEEEYLRELFLRLQLGLLLITGEKLHAATGAMQKLVFSASRKEGVRSEDWNTLATLCKGDSVRADMH